MALLTNRPNWTNLIKFTKAGIEVANYVEIRAAIVERLKEIFGQDIDLATNTADGQKVELDTLILNNIFQAVNSMYANLDADMAEGIYLDRLCKLSNVYRKPALRSTASLNITINGANLTVGPGGTVAKLVFADINGTTWTWQPAVLTTLTVGTQQSIIVTCDQTGKIEAQPGAINKLIDTTYSMTIAQPYKAEVGTDEETDAELRARRSGSLSVNAKTVLQSLRARILDVAAIQDILIYNNDSISSQTAKDTTSIAPHSVYVILRYLDNADISDALIGTILYEYMTPGIHFAQTSDSTHGIAHSYTYSTDVLTQQAHWKKAVPMHPKIKLTIDKLTHYTDSKVYSGTFSVETKQIIANAVKDYMNNLALSTDAQASFIKAKAQMSDPLFKSQATFFVSDCKVWDADANDYADSLTNPDTYYDYSGTITIVSETSATLVMEIE